MLPIIGEASQEVSEAINTADVKEIADTVVSFISGTLTLLLKNIKLMVLDEPTEGIQPNVVSEIATTLFQKQVLLFVPCGDCEHAAHESSLRVHIKLYFAGKFHFFDKLNDLFRISGRDHRLFVLFRHFPELRPVFADEIIGGYHLHPASLGEQVHHYSCAVYFRLNERLTAADIQHHRRREPV